MTAPIHKRNTSTPKRFPPQRRHGARQRGVQLWVRSRPRPRLWLKGLSWLLVALLLWGAANCLVLSLRWGAQLMLDPEALPWLQSQLWPESTRAEAPKTVTLEALSAEITAQGHQLGAPLKLTAHQGATEADYWLLPIQAPAKQAGTAANILELRFYRLLSAQPAVTLQTVAALPVSPLNPAVVSDTLRQGSDKIVPPRYPLPLTEVVSLRAVANQGLWLTLQGHWSRGGSPLRYGQLIYVNLQNPGLEPLLAWSSPSNRLPQWLDLEGADPIDLLIDDTLGLDPSLQGYRVQTNRGKGSVKLLPVTLIGVPTDVVDRDGAYYKALVLARSRLWAASAQQLQALKARLKQDWTLAAEAQLRLVASHATLTRTQADRRWSSPSQQILAQLIDGRWAIALKQLEAAPAAQATLMEIFSHDQGRFWNRVAAALQIQPQNPSVLVWGGLILKAQQSSEAALVWLTEQKAPAAIKQQFQALAQPKPSKVSPPKATGKSSAAPPNPAANRTGPAIAALLGTARPLTNPNLAQWQLPTPAQAVSLSADDTWYEVEVGAWQQADQWRSGAAETDWGSGSGLWQQVEPALQSSLTLLIWTTPDQARPLSLRPRGVQVRNGRLKVLASGLAVPDPAQRPALAFSRDSLVWLDPKQSQVASVEKNLVAALQQAIAPHKPLEQTQVASLLNQIRLHTLDITGDGGNDFLLTLEAAVLDQLADLGVPCDRTAPKTILVNAVGHLLYSDLRQPQTLIALTQPQPTHPTALLVEHNGQYVLKAWSKANQQFE